MKQAPTLLIHNACTPLGSAIARLACEHYRVALLCRDTHRGEILCREMHAEGREALVLEIRDGQPRDFQLAVERVLRRWQQLDAIVNLPASLTVGPFEAMTQQHWESLYQTQLMATVNLCQSANPAMRDQEEGRILNVIHEYGLLPGPLSSAQGAMGAAIRALAESLHSEWHSLGIHVGTMVIPPSSGQQSGLTASDPLSAARFRRQLAASDFSEREVAEDVMSALAREDVLSVPTPRIRRQWRQKRWFRKRWEALMKARAKRYR
ncbi:hypothetical protein Q670_05510 [Alcanivorax sp. P2S70]|uniref:SDR family NAD(P)-dependent oxidoreductase n=1 Tax=Alcanivorax TaxID=59753 RepID=UPI0003B5A68A|nr:SDR family NAD(P)-dependent oxidoreductase [Alcanivorax sp. P2S70]ERP86626.1 hypothetical protein Q670_05510 [Alcanivorax sp. P2S70]